MAEAALRSAEIKKALEESEAAYAAAKKEWEVAVGIATPEPQPEHAAAPVSVDMSADKLPEATNSKGEKHPDVYLPHSKESKERAREFVLKNCTQPVAAVFDEVYDYAESKGLKGFVPFAIAFADTTCGKHLSTPNNPMNYGNNDRGHRVGYFTMAEGFKSGIDGLNNKYLGGNRLIGELSQGGRNALNNGIPICAHAQGNRKCYATSAENWHKNAIRAITAIVGEPVGADFSIRM